MFLFFYFEEFQKLCLISLSKFLYLLISSAAVLIPIPGTPGTLSEESPASDCTSIT